MNGNRYNDNFNYAYSERIGKHNHHVMAAGSFTPIYSCNNQGEAMEVRDKLNTGESTIIVHPNGTCKLVSNKDLYPSEEKTTAAAPPEKWTIKKDTINALVSALAATYENTKELLAQHDSTCGRTTRKNKEWAETLERDMHNAEKALDDLHNWINSATPIEQRR